MKILRKILCSVLVLVVLLSNVLTVSASQTTFPLSQSERLDLINALLDIEPQKDLWGLEDVNFSELNVGKPVQTYNYIDGEFEDNYVMYPLTVGKQLVLWAIPFNGQFQITSSLVFEINTLVNFNTPFALIYDANKAYLYSNQSFSVLKNFDAIIEDRSVLNTNTRLTIHGIDTVSLSENAPLAYDSKPQSIQRTTPANIALSVDYVTQHPYDKLCWAASTACIVNYVKGTSLDAVSVAQKYYGNTNFNQGIGPDNLTEKIKGYGLEYYQFSNYYEDFDDKILRSILAYNPVGGAFDVVGGAYHATVIYGINVIAGRIQVMDPEFGRTTATTNSYGNYTYISSYTGATLVLYAVSYDTGD